MFQFDDVGIVIRGKFMAKPGTQFTIRKEIYNRVNAAFAENGIEFARREVRVALPNSDGDDKLTDDEKRAIAGAHKAKDESRYMVTKVVPAMAKVRAACDELEGEVPYDLWPLPTYREMLFVK